MALTISSRNARFQQWQALLGNRSKRQRAGEFIVQGVRPITMALGSGWPVRALLFDADRPLSSWARSALQRDAPRFALAGELMAELGDRDEAPEVLAVVEMPPDDLARLDFTLSVVFDRPTSPGNIGTLIRSADAFGATSVLVTGHAADPYDPRAVRASAGSVFAVPVVRAGSHGPVLDRLGGLTAPRPRLVGTDEHGDLDVYDADLTGPLMILVGNETAGLSSAWRDACDLTVRIPMTGTASSLNAATAATVVLYEAARQRRR